MSRALVAAKPIKLPKELEQFFDNPPLVGNERREDYENFFWAIAQSERPADEIEWILLKNYVDLCWEIRRERQVKVDIIKLKQKEAKNPSGIAMTWADFERQKAIAAS
jgi:hypothetical protein